MQKNSTPLTTLENEKKALSPKKETLDFLINFSKSLEVKKTQKGYVEYLKN